METIAAPLDWLGLNYYFRQIVTADESGPVPHARQVPVPGAPVTYMDWEVHAEGLEQLLLRLTEEYGATKIYVTENGSAYQDTVAADGSVHDPERTQYLEQHLAACGRAVAKGLRSPGTSRGRCSTTSSGPTGTTSDSGWFTSITTPSAVR